MNRFLLIPLAALLLLPFQAMANEKVLTKCGLIGEKITNEIKKNKINRAQRLVINNQEKCIKDARFLASWSGLAMRQRRVAEALDLINKSFQISPNDPDTLAARAMIRSQTNNIEGALEDLNNLLKIDRRVPEEIYSMRALVKNKGLDFEGALADSNKAISINPHEQAYRARGWAKTFLGDFAGALEDLNQSIKMNPYPPNAYFLRGIANGGLKNKDEACKDFKTAKRLDPLLPDELIKSYISNLSLTCN